MLQELQDNHIQLLKKIMEALGKCFMQGKPFIINIACGNLPANDIIIAVSDIGDLNLKEHYEQGNKIILDHINGIKSMHEGGKEWQNDINKKRGFVNANITQKDDGGIEIKF